MRIIKQLAWILLFTFIGEIISLLFKQWVVIPGSVIGMILLFLALHWGWLPMTAVDEVATWLSDNMGLMFIPAGVGLMAHFDLIRSIWLQLFLIVIVSVSILLVIIGRLVQWLKRRTDQKHGQGEIYEGNS